MRAPTPFPSVSPALLTGNADIDQEHRLLLGIMGRLREICADFLARDDCHGCPHHAEHRCDNALVETLGDLLMFLVDHFRTEEDLMRTGRATLVDRDLCELHKEDHAAISHTVQRIVASLDPARTAAHIRQLDELLVRWVENHIKVHDQVLVRMLQPQPAA